MVIHEDVVATVGDAPFDATQYPIHQTICECRNLPVYFFVAKAWKSISTGIEAVHGGLE